MEDKLRPTKKQKQLLGFIEVFINEHGYSPSYREIMRGCGYNSVATVALHVNSLITRGHLRKRDRSARSIEVVNPTRTEGVKTNLVKPTDEKWLVDQIDQRLRMLQDQQVVSPAELENIEILVQALHILGGETAAALFLPKLAELERTKVE